MRDPERIDRILAQLKILWQAHPDLRLGQLVANLGRHVPYSIFYLEDDVIETRIAEVIEKGF